MMLRHFIEFHRTHDAGDLDELTVLLTAGELLVSDQFGHWQLRFAEDVDLLWHDDGGEFTGTGCADDLDQLPRQQMHRQCGIEQIHACRLILDEPREKRLLIERHHAAQPHLTLLLRLIHRQSAHRRSRA